ncbi:aminoglycoside phosphotransferase family protein [Cellulomonas sp. HZM]|uniref:aminoglycoside phosphotransferase family protein n=1 Tax=Cellulomonas sp. HZM TaxID=1454010 RepID=UPI00049371EC|nr:aminoglycoside phosphotransferase family protein [Cellulomonas sp. HZM]
MTGLPRHPKIEVDVDVALARALVAEQHPDLAHLPVHDRSNGWDNITWRLGDELALRFPVRASSAPLLEHEAHWLPTLAPRLPVAIPVPVRAGAPGPSYPWPWHVVRWVEGTVVAEVPVAERTTWAGELAVALAALHTPAPPDAPANPFRGVPLAERDAVVAARLADDLPHAAALRDAWADGLAARRHAGSAVWLHGDPHPANLLAEPGRLTGLIDFGDLTSGDPASDLATAWLTFDAAGREAFVVRTRELRAWDDATWVRARAWAAALVPVLLAHPHEYPLLAAVGRHAADQVAHPQQP